MLPEPASDHPFWASQEDTFTSSRTSGIISNCLVATAGEYTTPEYHSHAQVAG